MWYCIVSKVIRAIVSIAILLPTSACLMSYTHGGSLNGEILRATKSGAIIGFIDESNGSSVWKGIPFARPPLNELRWRAPKPPKSWSKILRAHTASPVCVQPYGDSYRGNEDCLYLNIWSPRLSSNEISLKNNRLPVMVWIHGGANIVGSGNAIDAGELAVSQKVIVVAPNYRLGHFGWLTHAALRGVKTTADDQSGNYGMLDIIQALQWVQENIFAFGGDPNRVTVFGVSAGARNTASLLVSPRAKGLFHGAIIQSGGTIMSGKSLAENFIDSDSAGHPQSSGELLLQLLEDDGISKNRKEAKNTLKEMRPTEIAQYLRAKSYAQLDRAFIALANKHKSKYFFSEQLHRYKINGSRSVPKLFKDGIVLSNDGFQDLLKKGMYHKIPIIIGSNRDEDKSYLSHDPEFISYVKGKREINNKYLYDLTAKYITDLRQAATVDEPAEIMCKSRACQIFSYRFDWDDLGSFDGENLTGLLGAAHGAELPFVFGRLKQKNNQHAPPGFEDIHARHLSQSIMSYWAEFAYSGAPRKGRKGELPQWRIFRYDGNVGEKLLFDVPDGGGIRMDNSYFTKEEVLRRLTRGTELDSLEARCRLYQKIIHQPITRIVPGEYNLLENGACVELFPLNGI